MRDDGISGFEAEVTRDEGHAVLAIRGEIDLSTAVEFREALDRAMEGCGQVVIDLSATTFMDSSGLAVLVDAHQRLGQAREALVLRDPSPMIRRMLAISGVGPLLDVHPPLDPEVDAGPL